MVLASSAGHKRAVRILLECFLVTVRKRSCGKVIIPQACVKNSVHRGGCLARQPPPRPDRLARHPLAGRLYPPPPQADGHCSGRYATYWNAFLLFIVFGVTLRFTHELFQPEVRFFGGNASVYFSRLPRCPPPPILPPIHASHEYLPRTCEAHGRCWMRQKLVRGHSLTTVAFLPKLSLAEY